MEPNLNSIDPLLERAEAYGKTSFELLRLKGLLKTAEVSSSFLSGTVIVLLISFFAFTINIAIALWIGDLLGKAYYGFFIVAGFYAIISIVLLLLHSSIKSRVNNAIIKQLFN
jgi:hypothetical protein